jgi:hypothetical protein
MNELEEDSTKARLSEHTLRLERLENYTEYLSQELTAWRAISGFLLGTIVYLLLASFYLQSQISGGGGPAAWVTWLLFSLIAAACSFFFPVYSSETLWLKSLRAAKRHSREEQRQP